MLSTITGACSPCLPSGKISLCLSVCHLHGWSTLIGIGRRIELSMQASPMDAAAFLQLADDDSLYTNVAAMLTGPQDQLIRAPDASFAWSPCTYTLTTSEGSWPISMSSAPPCVDMHAVPQPYRTCG